MAFTIKARLAPPGSHRAKLTGIDLTDGQFGKPAIQWTFTITDGPHKGLELVKVTGAEARLGTSLGNLLNQLYGHPLGTGDSIDPEADLLGREFDIFAIPGSNGGAVIQKVAPAPAS